MEPVEMVPDKLKRFVVEPIYPYGLQGWGDGYEAKLFAVTGEPMHSYFNSFEEFLWSGLFHVGVPVYGHALQLARLLYDGRVLVWKSIYNQRAPDHGIVSAIRFSTIERAWHCQVILEDTPQEILTKYLPSITASHPLELLAMQAE